MVVYQLRCLSTLIINSMESTIHFQTTIAVAMQDFEVYIENLYIVLNTNNQNTNDAKVLNFYYNPSNATNISDNLIDVEEFIITKWIECLNVHINACDICDTKLTAGLCIVIEEHYYNNPKEFIENSQDTLVEGTLMLWYSINKSTGIKSVKFAKTVSINPN